MLPNNVKEDLAFLTIKNPIKLCLFQSEPLDLFFRLEAFGKALKNIKPQIEIVYKKDSIWPAPALKITNVIESIGIYYMAIPKGVELSPFFQVLKAVSESEAFLSPKDKKRIADIKKPVLLKVFIMPQCLFCPLVVSLATQLSIIQPLIQTFIIDGSLYPGLVRQHKITSAPTVIINEDYLLVGNEAKEKLIEWVIKAGERMLDSGLLASFLKQGRAEEVVGLCLKDKKTLFTLITLLKDEEMFIRIGVMRVLEELAEKSPFLIEKIMPKLLQMLETPKERDQGDLLFLLGLIGTPELIPKLQQIAQEASPIIKETALEAIKQIKDKPDFILH
jgi:hypothetical protein